MGRLIRIPFPDTSFEEKTRLMSSSKGEKLVEAGAGELYFRSLRGFSEGDFFVIEAFESDDAEILQIESIFPEERMVSLKGVTQQSHYVGVTIVRTAWDKVKVYKGQSGDVETHTEIGGSPFPLRPDTAYTVVEDRTGTAGDYYSYAYYNSEERRIGDRILYEESEYDAVLTVRELKDWFMFGLDLTDDDGYPFPESMFEFGIKAAVDNLEKVLAIKIKPTDVVQEYHDFYAQDYRDFCFIRLNWWPVIEVKRIQVKYPTADTPIEFPLEWVQLRKDIGMVHLLPTSGSLSTILMGKGGDYLTFVWRGYDYMPNLWRVDYKAGFEKGKVPADIRAVVGKLACFYPLNIAGDLVGGVAIASKSIGIDGLSQSINTTSSAENAGYSARLRQYERELKVEIPRLINYYSGIKMAVA